MRGPADGPLGGRNVTAADTGHECPFRIEAEAGGDTVVLALVGDLDGATAPLVDFELDGIDLAATRQVVLDVRDVPFVDSSGLGAVIRAYKRLQRAGVALRLSGASPNVRFVLHLSGLDQVVPVDDDALPYSA